MRICIPTQNDCGVEAEVCGHFGSAPYFMIYDGESKKHEFIENSNAHHSHGMCQPLGLIGSRNIGAIVCQGIGMGAYMKVTGAGIKVFAANAKTAQQVIKDFEANLLEEISTENTCSHHGCH